MTKGILIPAFGRQGYAFAAYNLLKSIKYHNHMVVVHVLMDETCMHSLPINELQEFDKVTLIPTEQTLTHNRIDPSKVKLGIYDWLPFDETLVLDADNICLKDIAPLLEYYSKKESYFYLQNVHSGKLNDPIDYMWVENKHAWDFFQLKEDSIFHTLQTSSMWIKKCAKAKALFKDFLKWYEKGFDKHKLKGSWGTGIPDELIISGVLSRKNMNCDGGVKVDFLGHKMVEDNYEQIEAKHYLLSLYGSGKPGMQLTRDFYKEWADRLMQKIMHSFMGEHKYKTVYIFRDKHANFT